MNCKASVIFAILPDGSLSPEGFALEISTHRKALDQAALLAVRESAHLVRYRISFTAIF